jgi:hypothetical protein
MWLRIGLKLAILAISRLAFSLQLDHAIDLLEMLSSKLMRTRHMT